MRQRGEKIVSTAKRQLRPIEVWKYELVLDKVFLDSSATELYCPEEE